MLTMFVFGFIRMLAEVYNFIVPGFLLPVDYLKPIPIMVEYAMKFNGLIPVATGLMILRNIILFEITMMTARVLIGIINFARGSGSIEID